jgi:cytochrome c peroxidase
MIVAFLLGAATACRQPPSPGNGSAASGGGGSPEIGAPPVGSYHLPPIQDAADGKVVDADGSERRLFDYMGDRYVLLSFIYTSCRLSEGCPLATAVFHRVMREMDGTAELAGKVRLISLSFDPERDTPEEMRRYAPPGYLKIPGEDRDWVFLTTRSRSELQPILDDYGQYIVPEVDEAGEPTGDIAHLLKVFLIDRQRRVRNIYSSGYLHPTVALNDLKTLLLEDAGLR